MKKLILIGLSMAITIGASAQNWTPQSFIADNVVNLTITNSGAAGGGVTNLLSTTGQGGLGPGTNIALTSWWQKLNDVGSNALQSTVVTALPPWTTNAAYTNYITAALNNSTGTNTLATKNLLDSMVSLWCNRDSNPQMIAPISAGNSNAFGTIFVRTVGSSATATNPITVVVEGVPFVDKDGNTIACTLPAERFIFNAAVSNGVIVTVTNFPSYKFIGFRGMRVGSTSMANADGNAGNSAYLTHLYYLGFIP